MTDRQFILLLTTVLLLCGNTTTSAHDPVFGLGPHVLFKQGIEIHIGQHEEKIGSNKTTALDLELTYGLSGDWVAGFAFPYLRVKKNTLQSNGTGDARLFTKYRFWREDSLGLQQSAAIFLNVILNNGDDNKSPALGSGTTDTQLGLSYGYESLTWYRWSSIRYRHNSEDNNGLRRGNMSWFDLALGLRLKPPTYLKADTVWLIEINGEHNQATHLNGLAQANSGGTEWFISPGIFWTLRNFAIKAGVQFPIISDLKGKQIESDYRSKLELEWHL